MSAHALHRLRQRHSLDLAPDELAEIAARLSSPTRNDPSLFRFVCWARGFKPVWQCNLQPYFGKPLWVSVVYSFASRKIVTVLDVPVNSTIDAANEHIMAYPRRQRNERQRQQSVEYRSRLAIGA